MRRRFVWEISLDSLMRLPADVYEVPFHLKPGSGKVMQRRGVGRHSWYPEAACADYCDVPCSACHIERLNWWREDTINPDPNIPRRHYHVVSTGSNASTLASVDPCELSWSSRDKSAETIEKSPSRIRSRLQRCSTDARSRSSPSHQPSHMNFRKWSRLASGLI